MKIHYFNGKLSSGFVALFSGRMLQFAGNGMLGLFLPVYLLLQFNLKIEYVLLWYLAGHLFYAILLPWGAQFLNKFGMRRSLRVSVFLDALYLGCVYLIAYNVLFFAGAAIFFITLLNMDKFLKSCRKNYPGSQTKWCFADC